MNMPTHIWIVELNNEIVDQLFTSYEEAESWVNKQDPEFLERGGMWGGYQLTLHKYKLEERGKL